MHRPRWAPYNEDMTPILDIAPATLAAWLAGRAQPRMRVKQVRRWLLQGRAESFEQMTDLPLNLRQALAEEFVPLGTHVARHLEAQAAKLTR